MFIAAYTVSGRPPNGHASIDCFAQQFDPPLLLMAAASLLIGQLAFGHLLDAVPRVLTQLLGVIILRQTCDRCCEYFRSKGKQKKKIGNLLTRYIANSSQQQGQVKLVS